MDTKGITTDMNDYHKVFTDPNLYFQNYVRRWSQKRWNRLNQNQPRETDVAAALLATDTPLESLIIEFICQQIGHTITDISNYRLMGIGSQKSIKKLRYADEEGTKSLRVPDMFLVALPPGTPGNTENDDGDFQLIAAIELKRSASVNGGFNYCPQGKHSEYSNQIICYANNCWIDPHELNLLPTPPQYIWLAPQRALDKGIPYGAIYKTDTHPKLASAYPVQGHAWKNLWKKVALEDLIHTLAKDSKAQSLANLIRQWITNY